MKSTKIGWCDSTINPVVGCTYGCDFCYARRMNNRFHYIENFSKPQFFPERLEQLKSKKPKNIFMDSMSDIADWTPEQTNIIFSACKENPQHNYLFLTKRPQHLCFLAKAEILPEGKNFWWGTTVITQNQLFFYSGKYNTFLSIEPIMSEFVAIGDQNKHVVCDWIIIGAETGNRKHKVIPKPEWIQSIVNQCKGADIPVFMKDSLIPIIDEENMRREFPEGLRK